METVITGAFCVLTGVTFVVLCLGSIREARQSRRFGKASLAWPSVPGRIETSQIISDEGFCADVRYAYAVSGRAFTGDRVAFRPAEDSWAGAGRTVARYAPGTDVCVFYDPADPARSVLEPSAPGPFATYGLPGFLLLVSLVQTAFGVVLIITAWTS